MRIPSLALLLLLFFSNFSYAGSLRAVEVVALTGDIALGSSGATFTGFESAYILLNDFGQVVFGGKLDSSSSTNAGIWSNGGGNGLALIAREGDIAPGTGSDRFFISFVTSFNDFGQTGLFSILNNNSLNTDHGIWSEGGSGLALVARGGSVAPGGGTFFQVGAPAINNTGLTVFGGGLAGGGRGFWSKGGSGGLTLVAREGDMAPGAGGDIFLQLDVFRGSPLLNDLGQIAFHGFLNSSSSTNSGIWLEGGGSGLALVAREGDAAPGAGGANFSGFNDPRLNDLGQTAFRGFLSSGFTDAAIWSEGGGNGLALVAREGDMAPGTNGDTFVGFGSLVLNDEGQAAFTASLSSGAPGTSSIWAQDSSGTLTLIAQIGDLLDVDDGLATNFREISDLSVLDASAQSQPKLLQQFGTVGVSGQIH